MKRLMMVCLFMGATVVFADPVTIPTDLYGSGVPVIAPDGRATGAVLLINRTADGASDVGYAVMMAAEIRNQGLFDSFALRLAPRGVNLVPRTHAAMRETARAIQTVSAFLGLAPYLDQIRVLLPEKLIGQLAQTGPLSAVLPVA